jgi:hypothetical protein
VTDGSEGPLVCPSCARSYPPEERFCADCGMPLVHAGADAEALEPVSAGHERARKIKPQYAEGDLTRVAGARNQAEAEFIQGLLLEEGVPSLIRRTAGFDVPDFLAAGPRDVMVPASGAGAAREALLEAEIVDGSAPPTYRPAPVKLLAGILVAVALVAIVVWLGTDVI